MGGGNKRELFTNAAVGRAGIRVTPSSPTVVILAAHYFGFSRKPWPFSQVSQSFGQT
jgi:hypothetical protein